MSKPRDEDSELSLLKGRYRELEERYAEARYQAGLIPVQSIIGLDQKVVQVDSGLRIVYANTAMAAVLGIPKGDIPGKLLSDIDKFAWGPGFLTLLTEQCRTLGHEIVKDRGYFDRKKGRDASLRITVTRVANGFQIMLEDRSEFVDLERRFARYVSPKVIDAMKALGRDFDVPRRYELSVLFADLRGFTALSETLPPDQVRETINLYLEAMLAVIEHNDAMVDKIVGDSVMVLCGAPIPRDDHALQAVKTGLEMLKTHEKLVSICRAEGKAMPLLGIGINSGEMVVGNIGTARRSDFTVLGHQVNLASRLCDAAGEGELVVTESTRAELLKSGLPPGVECVEKGDFQVKGVKNPVRMFRLSAPEAVVGKLEVKPVGAAPVASKAFEKRVFGKYQILDEAGRGGMGIVYKAMHTEIGKIVALKILKAADFAQEGQLKMFHREIETMSRLNHPNIVNIHDVGEVVGQRYFTMDFLDGCTLNELMDGKPDAESSGSGSTIRGIMENIRKHRSPKGGGDRAPAGSSAVKTARARSLHENHALNIILKLIRAVEHAHDRGLIHRDIKPGNIMITGDGEPVLMDFGLARDVSAGSGPALTLTGQVMGTPAYMSPEQAQGEKAAVNERTDIYALGSVLYEMLCGRPPLIPSGNAFDDIRAIVERDPPSLGRLNPKVSSDLTTIVQKAMDKSAARRYRTAGAFAEDIQRFINGDPVQARPPSALYRFRKRIQKHRTAAAVIAVLLLAGAGFGAYWMKTKYQMFEKERTLLAEREKAEGRWLLVYENDFESGVFDSANWYYRKPELNTLEYGVENGMMYMEKSGRIFSTRRVPGNIKIECDVKSTGGAEIHFYIKCDTTYGENLKFYRAMWAGDVSYWQRGGRNDLPFFKEALVPAIQDYPNTAHFTVSYVDGKCNLSVDGKTFVETRDVFTFDELSNAIWGFRTYQGKLYLDNLKVYRQLLPELVDVTRLSEIMLLNRDSAGALDHMLKVMVYYDNAAVVEKAVSQLINFGPPEGRKRVFLAALSNRQVMDNLFVKIGPASGRNFLEGALQSFPLMNGDLERAVDHFSRSRTPQESFSFHVYLGLFFNTRGDPASSKKHFNKAQALKDDPIVRKYLSEGVHPARVRRDGFMAPIPAGYLPDEFGKVERINSFYMDTTEVTQRMYFSLMGRNIAPLNGRDSSADRSVENPERPVSSVTLWDAVLFCNKRSKSEGLDTCYSYTHVTDTVIIDEANAVRWEKVFAMDAVCHPAKNGYRLPLESEFEYALRAGSTEHYFWGSDTSRAGEYAWYDDSTEISRPVARKKPNGFGLYDMHGNVMEWCHSDLHNLSVSMVRGGHSGSSLDQHHKASAHYFQSPPDGSDALGFRCVRSAEP